jgi:hypothetical protein
VAEEKSDGSQVRQDVTAGNDAFVAGRDIVFQPAPAVSPLAVSLVRVGDADHRRLGVHSAISVPGVPDEVPTEYVRRDIDTAEFGIRALVAAAARRGGFVLLVGGSSVGKTRSAFEAVRDLLPDWQLAHPAGPVQATALAQAAPASPTVVWLDELQRYLDGEHGLTGSTVHALLSAPEPMVIIGTLWPDLYGRYTRPRVPGGADPRGREREVLELASVIHVGPQFSPSEQEEARAAAARDRRLAVALQSAGYGLTQTLAAAPQLVALWEGARTDEPYGWAVLTAALDAARLGARAPLSTDFLRAAAPGYCTSQQQAEAPQDWFGQAMAHVTGKLHGAACALAPAGAGMGQVAGYAPADYLVQYARQQRHGQQVPASTWDAIVSHLGDSDDATRLADSARNRLLYGYAIPLYRRAAGVTGGYAARELAELLAKRGDLDGLRAQARAGNPTATWLVAQQSGSDHEALQVLRGLADDGDLTAAEKLAELLAERGDLVQLKRLGDRSGVFSHAVALLAELLTEQPDLREAFFPMADWDRSYWILAFRLARDMRDPDWLRRRADSGFAPAAEKLAELLAARGDLTELQARADAGDYWADLKLAELRAERGDVTGLRARADAGDDLASRRLAELQAVRGDLTGLQAQAGVGVGTWLAQVMADALTKQGRAEEARRLLQLGLNPDGSIARA